MDKKCQAYFHNNNAGFDYRTCQGIWWEMQDFDLVATYQEKHSYEKMPCMREKM